MRRSGRKLKTGLYGVPVLLFFVMALTIYIVFHLAVNTYVARLAERNIEARFAVLDAYYQSSAYEGFYDAHSDFIITVRHMIFDEKGDLLSPSTLWESKTEVVRAKEIAARCSKDRQSLRDGQGKTLELDENTWYLMQRTYIGSFDGSFVVKSAGGQTYSVLAYIDITPIAVFSRLLDRVLLFLIAGLSAVTAGLFLSAVRRFDQSFQSLKTYILRVGERKRSLLQKSCLMRSSTRSRIRFFRCPKNSMQRRRPK